MRKAKRRVRPGAIVGGVFAALIIAAILIIATPISNVSEVDVVGNTKLSTNEILSIAKIERGKTKIFFKTKKRMERLLGNPYVKKASIERKFLGKVIIKIVERKSVAYLKKKQTYYFVAIDGIYMRKSTKRKSGVLITGVAITEATPAKTLKTDNDIRFKDALLAYKNLKEQKIKIAEIDIGAAIPRLYIRKDFLIEGELDLVAKSATKIKRIRQKLKQLKKTTGRIIVGKDNYFAYSPKLQ
jgi:cell division septal protein FtsQ